MIKNILLLFLFSFIFPIQVKGQTIEPSTIATVSPQIRNRLQLLLNPKAGDSHFQRVHRRLKALLSRLTNINNRIEKRITKITASTSTINMLNSELKSISSDLDDISKELTKVENSWQTIKENKNREDYEILRNRMTNLFKSMNSVLAKEKTLLKELKKYRSTLEPTQTYE